MIVVMVMVISTGVTVSVRGFVNVAIIAMTNDAPIAMAAVTAGGWGVYLKYHLHPTLSNAVCVTLHSKDLKTTVIAILHQPCMVLSLSKKDEHFGKHGGMV